ncbi:MAG TPA: hypothetical protein VFU02_13720, partial [Polyangiaceae bacterium]|nr:hypothetical protein [Polyangiaceae bacterium]
MIENHSPNSPYASLEKVSDQELLDDFGKMVRDDHERTADLLRHIDLIDRRQLWAKRGHPSMFDLLVTRYHMSESTAGKRIGAARTARRFPMLFTMVARGEIHLSGIHRLKGHLTLENYQQVLGAAKHKTMRQIEELVARVTPQPDVPSTLRALPQRPEPTSPALSQTPPAPAQQRAPQQRLAPQQQPMKLPPPQRSPDPAPLSPGRYRLQVTLSQAARDTLEQLQDLLAHQIPNGDPAAIVERALDALLTQVHKRKTGSAAKPRARKVSSKPSGTSGRRTRFIEVAERRAVWARDEGRCGFVGEDGHRCNETRGLEFAHIHPWAKGGADTADNLGLRCIAHNAFEAERDYGTSFMASKRKQKRKVNKPLQVREPVARYQLREGTGLGVVPVAPTRGHASGAVLGVHPHPEGLD